MRRFSFLHLGLLLAVVAVVGGALILARYHAAHGEEPSTAEQLSEVYTHPELGFSFHYPGSFRVHELPYGKGSETVLVEDPAHARQEFQVFTQPYDEDGPLTEARIKQDQPAMAIEDPVTLQVAGVLALRFVRGYAEAVK
jgi:hypothetical protein